MAESPSRHRTVRIASPKDSGWTLLAVILLTVTAVFAGLTLIWNFDIFWHLASGEWMLRNLRVLGVDPFSIDPEPQWVNVHWLFQIIVAVAHRIGGFNLLSVLKAALCGLTMLAFALGLRKRVPPAWLIVCGLAMLVVMDDRIRVRPELFTLLFIVITIILVEHVRRGGSPNWLWWLAPIMVVWVNTQGLYILGLGIVWSAVLGAAADRSLGRALHGKLLRQGALVPIAAATVAVLISPWPVTAAAQPLLLWTRISGQAAYYSYAVTELQPTWRVFEKFPMALALLAASVGAMTANRRCVPVSHMIWILAFGLLGALAIRNTGLIGPVCGYLLAIHGGPALRRSAARLRWAPLRLPANIAAVILAAILAAGYMTGIIYRLEGIERSAGLGLTPDHYPVKAAKFLNDLRADGDILCANFGDAGVFIYHCHPRRRLWMDGRLEAHSLDRFVRHHQVYSALRTARSAETVELPRQVRFVIIRRDDYQHLQALSAAPRFRLIYIDPAGACFARTDWPGAGYGQDLPERPDPSRFQAPLERLLSLRRPWYQRALGSGNLKTGSMLMWLAGPEMPANISTMPERRDLVLAAMRHLHAAGGQGLVNPDVAGGLEAQACQLLGRLTDPPADPSVPVDMDTARALYLFEHLRQDRLEDSHRIGFALERVRTMLQARHLDAADDAMAEMMDSLPAAQRVNPPVEYIEVKNLIAEQLAAARLRLHSRGIASLGTKARVAAMTAPDIGLIDRAISELRSIQKPSDGNLVLLGDLLLSKGKAAQARETYSHAELPQGQNWRLEVRSALCAWVEGDYLAAAAALAAVASSERPIASHYHSAMLERLGNGKRPGGPVQKQTR